MNHPDPRELESIAVGLAREAGDLARQRRSEGVSIAATKSALADIVTEADREVEALIRSRLRALRPADGFLGEESEADPGSSGVTWVVDPIDGTVNYAYGIPFYAVSIAAVRGSAAPESWTALAAAVYVPSLDEMFHAALGAGAWLDERRLHVEADASGAGALLATGFGYDPATHAGDLGRVARVMPIARGRPGRRVLRAGAQALGPRRGGPDRDRSWGTLRAFSGGRHRSRSGDRRDSRDLRAPVYTRATLTTDLRIPLWNPQNGRRPWLSQVGAGSVYRIVTFFAHR